MIAKLPALEFHAIGDSDVLLVVGSVAGVSEPGPALADFCRQALFLTERGFTVIVPSFSFDFCDTGVFDANESPTYCGSVAEYWRRVSRTRRTWRSPIHCVSVAGAKAEEIMGLTPSDGFGNGSVFEWMTQQRTRVCLLNVSLDAGVPHIHWVERQLRVKYRLPVLYRGTIRHDGRSDAAVITRYIRTTPPPAFVSRIGRTFAGHSEILRSTEGLSRILSFPLASYLDHAQLMFHRHADEWRASSAFENDS